MKKRELKAEVDALRADYVKLNEAADFTLRKYAERFGEQEREMASLRAADQSLNSVLANVQQNLADIKLKRGPQDVLGQFGQIDQLVKEYSKLEGRINRDMKMWLENVNQVILGNASDVKRELNEFKGRINALEFKDRDFEKKLTELSLAHGNTVAMSTQNVNYVLEEIMKLSSRLVLVESANKTKPKTKRGGVQETAAKPKPKKKVRRK